jgi:3-methyladenine DNA glycosylase AlkD
MTLEEVMSELERLGNPQTAKIWENHGVTGTCFGVKVGDMKSIQKKIKHDHNLALALYRTQNADAMYFAGLICEPLKMTNAELQHWAQSANWQMISDYTVAWAASESPFGRELALDWINDPNEQIKCSGWNTYSNLLALKPDHDLNLEEIRSLLKRVQDSIHTQANRVKYNMNNFVISVGSYVSALTEEARKAARAIGKVEVYMGKTACKVPDALSYIDKVASAGKIGKKKKTVFC